MDSFESCFVSNAVICLGKVFDVIFIFIWIFGKGELGVYNHEMPGLSFYNQNYEETNVWWYIHKININTM